MRRGRARRDRIIAWDAGQVHEDITRHAAITQRCSGLITPSRSSDDGRYNIIMRGTRSLDS